MPRIDPAAAIIEAALEEKARADLEAKSLAELRAALEKQQVVEALMLFAKARGNPKLLVEAIRASQSVVGRSEAPVERQPVTIIVEEARVDAEPDRAAEQTADAGPSVAATGQHRLRAVGAGSR